MSASASKKKRKEDELTETSPKQLALQKEKEHKKKVLKTVGISVAAILVAAAIITCAVIFVSGPSYNVNTPVATIGDYDVSVPMFDYFYADAVNSFTSSYGSILSYVLDTSKSLGSQYYDENTSQTWADYFVSQAESNIQMYYNIYDYAIKDGYTLTDEDNAAVEETLDTLKSSAKGVGYSVNDYLEAVYGDGCNLNSYREYCELRQVVAGYYGLAEPSFESTADEVKAKYDADPSAVDTVSYLVYTVNASDYMPKDESGSDTTETTAATEAAEITDDARQQAKDAADAAVAEYPMDKASDASNNSTNVTSSISEEAATWLFAASRKTGDVKVFASEDKNTYRVLNYTSRDTHEYNLVDAYVINIPFDAEKTDDTADTDEEDSLTDEERLAAVKEGLKENMSAEDFSTLGTTYGTSFSGITNSIKKGAYADDMDAWLFDSARKDGDTKVFTEESNYYIVRFATAHENTYQYELAEDLLHTEKYDAWYEKVTSALTVSVDDEMRQYIHSDIMLSSGNSTAATE